jgi:hypothetical protein
MAGLFIVDGSFELLREGSAIGWRRDLDKTAVAELEGFASMQVERLEINQQLNDADGIGATLWNLAQLDLAEQKIDDAVPRILEAYGIVSKLGRAEGIAVIGTYVGQILAASKPDDARAVLRRSAQSTEGSDVKKAPRRLRSRFSSLVWVSGQTARLD